MHEAEMHECSLFGTFTIRDEDLPAGWCDSCEREHPRGELCVAMWQRFVKRLRKAGLKVRYYQVGEYGEQTQRPHHHAILYGFTMTDRELHHLNERGDKVYTSEALAEAWSHGHVTFGDVTWESAAYVARYAMKKLSKPNAVDEAIRDQQEEKYDERYARVNAVTGEVFHVRPEFATMSLKPGIGKAWFEKYKRDVFPSDFVIARGRKRRVPAYYTSLLEEEEREEVKRKRAERAQRYKEDQTPERLRTREEIKMRHERRFARATV